MESPFDVLGLETGSDEAAVERAYRRRVLETHPDRGGTVEAFQRVRAAYEAVLEGDWEPDRDGPWVPEEPTGPAVHRVEYLDYEAVEDHGWDLAEEDLFEAAAAADLREADHGTLEVLPGESLLQAAERAGFTWPYACRGGACANCAVAVTDGDLEMPANHVLPEEMMDRGIRLSCNGLPTREEMRVVYNLKRRPDLDDLRLPPHRFDLAHADD